MKINDAAKDRDDEITGQRYNAPQALRKVDDHSSNGVIQDFRKISN